MGANNLLLELTPRGESGKMKSELLPLNDFMGGNRDVDKVFGVSSGMLCIFFSFQLFILKK